MSKKYKATLVRGESYTIGSYIFLKGKGQIIDDKLKRKLEKSAIDRATIMQSENEKDLVIRQKFKFEEVAADTPTRSERFADLSALQGSGEVDFDGDDSDDDFENADEGFDDEGDTDSGDTEESIDESADEEPADEPAKPAAKPAKPARGGRGKR